MAFAGKRIAVIGGGLGGMAFMNSALHAGLDNVHLYEAAPAFTEAGAGVNISRNASLVLDALGLKDDMLRSSSRDPPVYMEYRHYRTGEYLGQIDEFGAPRSRQIHRAHLLDVLRENVPARALSTGKKLCGIEWDARRGCYRLSFRDGSAAVADIVVGCDGIKSSVRRHLGLDDDDDPPIYSGQMVYRGFVAYDALSPPTAALLRKTVNFRGPRRHVLTLPVGNEGSRTARVGVIAFVTEPLDGWTSESWLAKAPVDELHGHVADWTGAVQEIVRGLRKGAAGHGGMILKQALYVREPSPRWFEAREDAAGCGIVLMGDAVHSTLPHQGQGACMAIESGFALARILGRWRSDDGDLGAALQLFQDLRKPRTDRITKTSYETGKMASADVPEDMWAETFNPELLRERMKWVMEYDLPNDVVWKEARLAGSKEATSKEAGEVVAA